jgi:hypothetical protein
MAKTGHNGHGRPHVTETPDVSHIKNIDVTHEASDVSVSALLKFVLALTVMTIVVHVLMWGLFKFFQTQEEEKEPKAGPMAMTKEERLPPEPRLQAAPGFGVKLANGQWVPLENREPDAEYHVLREQWERQLNCKDGETARAAGCVSIEEAIQKVVQQGLPSRTPAGNSGRPPEHTLPTAASSGRMPVNQ